MYVIVDIETTGGAYNKEGITEIALYRFDGREVTDKLISLVCPDRPIMPFVQKLTGITDAMVRRAPKFYQIAKRIIDLTEGCTIVAHNAVFDYRMMRLEYQRLGYDYQRETLCTVDLSKKLIPGQVSYSLGKLSKSLGIAFSQRHRADGDARATIQLFKLLLSRDHTKSIISQHISTTEKKLSKKHIKILDGLPSDSGIYYIHNREGDIIYINKTANIRQRVTKHLLGLTERDKYIWQNIMEASFEITGNHLITDLKIHEELESLKPILNRPIDNEKQKNDKFSYRAQNIAIIDHGRTANERSIVILKNGILKGYGYYHLNQQLQPDILENIIIPIQHSYTKLQLVEQYLRKYAVLKIIEL